MVFFPPVKKVAQPFFAPCSEDAEVESEFSDREEEFEVQLVTEIWVEPQSGVVAGVNQELQYLEGLTYEQIPKAVSHQW